MKSKVLWTDPDAWNNRWLVYVGAPVLAALGVVIGAIWGSHYVSTAVGEVFVVGLSVAVTMVVGFTLLAKVD